MDQNKMINTTDKASGWRTKEVRPLRCLHCDRDATKGWELFKERPTLTVCHDCWNKNRGDRWTK